MTNNRFIFGVACAVFGIGVRLMTFTFGWDIAVSTQFYLLIILVSVFLGIRSIGIFGERSYRKLFKGGLQSGIITTVLISLYTYIHYRLIDVNYLADRVVMIIEGKKELGMTPEQLSIQEENARFIFSPSTHSTFTLAGFLIATVLYALLSSFLYKKVAAFSKF